MIEFIKQAKTFEALSHESRLSILRLLIPSGPDGVHAGAIAEALKLPANRLSFHLTRLTTAGLIESRREGRHLYYVVRYSELAGLVRFLIDDCCAAAPRECLPECPGMPVTVPGAGRSACGAGNREHRKGG